MKSLDNKEIGKRLFDSRRAKGMSRAELGRLINLHETTVKKYEDGDIKALSIDKLKEFAKFLDVSSAWLIGWENELGEKTDDYKEKKSFVTELLETMVRQGMITDPENIDDAMIKMIVDAVKLEAAKMIKDRD